MWCDLASMDIETAFDEARPRHVAKHTEDDRRCSSVWRASSHSIDVSAKKASKLPDGHAAIGKRGRSMGQERNGNSFGHKKHQISSFMWADNFWIMSHSKSHLEQMLRDLI